MAGPKLVTENIPNKINTLEAERQDWLGKLPRLRGAEKRLAQTALTQIEARLRWYRGRVEGKRPTRSEPYPRRKQRWASNEARLADVRS